MFSISPVLGLMTSTISQPSSCGSSTTSAGLLHIEWLLREDGCHHLARESPLGQVTIRRVYLQVGLQYMPNPINLVACGTEWVFLCLEFAKWCSKVL